jgi:carboxymethylenebutenolidase
MGRVIHRWLKEDEMTERVTFASAGGEVTGELATPDGSARAPGVVVIQEYWGINDQIKSTAERLAKEGFIAVVPDLYHGKIATKADEASKLMGALDWPKAMQEIAGAVAYVRSHARGNGKVGVIGFCMGGALSFAAAANIPGLDVVVPFYGVPGPQDYSKVTAPVQAHFATHDEWATIDAGHKIQSQIKGMQLHTYDAQHAFCNDRRPEVFNPTAAAQAWDRAIAFIRQHTA